MSPGLEMTGATGLGGPPTRDGFFSAGLTRHVGWGAAALAAGLGLALVAARVITVATSRQQAVGLMVVLLAATVSLAVTVATAMRTKTPAPSRAAGALLAASAIALVSTYLHVVSTEVALPADILIWSEGPFLSDILKMRTGYPVYTAPAELESFFYPPGSQWLTHTLARLVGNPLSVPTLRGVQLFYGILSSIAATLAALKIVALVSRKPVPTWTGAFLTPFLFLCATNPTTNPFAHLLHNDALATLVSATAALLLVDFVARRRLWTLAALAMLPAAGFLVKQSLVGLAGLVFLYLLLFDRQRSITRAVAYGAAAGAMAVGTFVACRVVWGPQFVFWVIDDLRHHPFSIFRSLQHVLDAWMWFGAAVVAAVLMGARLQRHIVGLWLFGVCLLSQQAYTSGIAWMLNHMGPGSLLTGTWLGAAIVLRWPTSGAVSRQWVRLSVPVAAVLVVYAGLGFVRIPERRFGPDLQRYARDIEHEFDGIESSRILLDAGTWVHVSSGHIPKDQVSAVGDLGSSGQGDYSGMIARVAEKHYARILVRSLGAPDFMYDHYQWARPSGIRAALLEHYHEVRKIPAVEGQADGSPFLQSISVLEPNE